MRTALLLLLCVLFLACAVQGQEGGSRSDQLSEEDLAAVQMAMEEGRAVPPAQAVAAVRSYWNTPDLRCVVANFNDEGPVGPFGTHYDVRGDEQQSPEFGGCYYVRASDGVVIGFQRISDSEEAVPTVDVAQARAIAEQFLHERYPPFFERRWVLSSEGDHDLRGAWRFDWYQILNAHGTAAPYPLTVEVGKNTGRVTMFFIPPDRITGPTVPQITLEQAKQLAQPHAVSDPALVPFTSASLGLTEGSFGIQYLSWSFVQSPPPTPESPAPVDAPYTVDAITGQVWVSYPLGGMPSIAPGLRPKKHPRHSKLCCPPAGPRARLRAAETDSPLPVPTQLRPGKLWLRAEGLRGLKARVEAERGRLEIREGKRRVAGAAVGAQFRDHGWWVPLRSVAAALGWRVDWQAKAREAVIHHTPPGPERS